MVEETTPTPTQDKQITVDVPEDRVAEFYAFYSRFLAGPRGRRGRGPGRHGHGRHGHWCGEHHEHQEHREPAEPEAEQA